MTFDDLRRDVLSRTLICGCDCRNEVVANERAANWIVAAATIVVADHGLDACRADLDQFVEWTIGRLGFWVAILLFFVGGTGVLWALARIILPILADWLTEQNALGLCGIDSGDTILDRYALEAVRYLDTEAKICDASKTGRHS